MSLARLVPRILTASLCALSLCALPACAIATDRAADASLLPVIPFATATADTGDAALDRGAQGELPQEKPPQEKPPEEKPPQEKAPQPQEKAPQEKAPQEKAPQEKPEPGKETRAQREARRKQEREAKRAEADRQRELDERERELDRRERELDRQSGDRRRDEFEEVAYPGYLWLSFAGGDYRFKDSVRGADRPLADEYRLRFGALSRGGTGGGIDVKVMVPNREIWDHTPAELDLRQSDVFVHFSARIGGTGPVRIPIRLGPYYNLIATEDLADERTLYNNFGARLEIEPTVSLVRRSDRSADLEVFCGLSAGAHVSYVDDDAQRDDNWTRGYTLALEPGLRLSFENLVLSTNYVFHETVVREDDFVPRTESRFEGWQVTLGVRF